MNARDNIEALLGQKTLEVPAAALFRALAYQIEDPAFREVGLAFAESSVPRIGSYWEGEGGRYAGVIRGGDSDYHLIVANAGNGSVVWGGLDIEEPGASSEYDGAANTLALTQSTTEHPAAKWATSLTFDGHSDFYLPARRELALLYANIPEQFEKAWHWSSTQSSADYAWIQVFGDGYQGSGDKGNGRRAVAVRRLAI